MPTHTLSGDQPLPLSSVQEVVWLDQSLFPATPVYNIGLAWQIRGEVDAAALKAAVNLVANGNDALRLVLCGEAGVARQRVLAAVDVDLPVIDFSGAAEPEAAARAYMQSVFAQPFDLAGGLLWSSQLVRVSADSSYWLQCYHHLVNDGFGASVVMHAVARVYNELLADCQPRVNGPSYREFLAEDQEYRASARFERDRQFWCERYATLPEPLLARSSVDAQGRVAPSARVSWNMARAFYTRLTAFGAAGGYSITHLMLAAVSAYFARVHGQEQVVIGVPVHNRGAARQKQTVGMFSSISPIGVRVDPQASFAELLAEVAAELRRCYRHQRFPIADINRSLKLAQAGRRQLYDVSVTTMNFDGDNAFGGAATRIVPMHHSVERTPLVVSIRDHHASEDVLVEFEYSSAVFERAQVERIQGAIAAMFEAVMQEPDMAAGMVPVMSKLERDTVLRAFNDTEAAIPAQLIHQLFEQQALARPHAIALSFEGSHLSYEQLNERANRIAHHLLAIGVKAGDRVALCVERSPSMVAALLGILKAGAGYVPLDPGFPSERLAYMLGDCAPAALVSETALAASLQPGAGLPLVLLDADAAAIGARASCNPDVAGLGAASLAYLIYTSGSTGLPKGVMLEHGSVVNFLASMTAAPGMAASDSLLAVTTLSFDIAGLELYLPLMNGARIVLASRDTASDAAALAQTIAQEGITVMQATPATWRMLLAGGWQGSPTLKVLCGGEALPADLAARLLACTGQLWNVYGPTETTIWSTCRRVTDTVESIGRPISNTQVYILDSRLQPVPIGASGEIFIGGAGVARGYFQRPELTTERFVADPFSAVPGARMYKTGDVGCWLANGDVAYQGRNDFQVKVRGFRIELGEIEARLAACAGVREAVVMARIDNPSDASDVRLVAYLLAQDGAILDAADLRAALQSQLADYMVPGAYVMLDAFPLTPNNKLDRKALPAPGQEALLQRRYSAPQDALEAAIAAIWQQLLDIDRVGRDDNFFDLGGHSLLAVQAAAHMREELNVELSLRDLFNNPTLAGFAAVAAASGRAALAPIAAAARETALPLSFAQQRLWFLDQFDHASSAAYHMAGALRLKGALDCAALQAALDGVIARHEALRTRFHDIDGHTFQVIDAAGCGFQLEQRDLGQLSAAAQDDAVRAAGQTQVAAPFDLAAGPLVRGQLLRLGADEHVLLIAMHHIVSDGWSVGVMLRDVSALYAASALPLLPIQYADYAVWQRSAEHGALLQTQTAFWKSHLEGAPALLELPTDRPRPAQAGHAGATYKFTLPAQLTRAVRALGQRHGATLFMTLLAGWSTLLARLSGQQDVVIGTPVANRQRAEIENLVGFFVNTLALRVKLDDNPSVAQLLAQVKASTIGAYDHQDLPFDQVVDAVQPMRSGAHGPLFQVMLSLNNAAGIDQLQLPGLQVSGIENPAPSSPFDLVLAITDRSDVLEATLTYAVELFDAATVARMAGQFQVLLDAMSANDALRANELPLLDAAQRDQLLNGFNDTAVPYPHDQLIHQLFETQAAAQPGALALLYLEQRVSYQELNERANRLAHHLIAAGIKTDDRVAICLERGIGMIVALLAVLKAGAGYVPLDAALPAQRLSYMLDDCTPAALLTQASLVAGLPASATATALLVLDAEAVTAAVAARPSSNPDPLALGLSARHLAYVIYTSGSTGLPKAVLNEHHSLCNLAMAQTAMFEVTPASRVLQFASFSFDASVFEMTMALCNGASFFLAAPDALLPGEPLLATLRQHGITHATLPSSLVATMPEDARLPLACLIMAGDVCPPLLAARWAREMAVFNAYGPTESTIWASAWRCGPVPCTSVPIGRPIANARMYILDAGMNPVPPGVTGEIYIGGVGVARGYLNRAQLSAERFLRDPFAGVAGARMYRSGDLGRFLADGNIEYQGRNDFQVKIRGFRIEPGEVEARLAACAGVRDAAVLAREDRPGDKRLVAYVVPHDGVTLAVAELRARLLDNLAEYMVPSAFVIMEALPLTSNGKLDRRALPVPGQSAVLARQYEAPQDSVETLVVSIWEQLLGLAPVGRCDSFFELGGHSLMAVQVVARLRKELGVDIGLRTLFDNPVLADFARAARSSRRHVMDAISLADRGAALPLSHEQQRLWFLDRLDHAAGAAYHIAGALRLRGTLDRDALQRALDRLIARHESLRTTFASVDGETVQRIAPAAPFALLTQDLGHLSGHELACAVARIGTDEGSARFDLSAGPLVRGQLLRLSDQEHILLVTQHHIISDGWSTGILVREVSALYAAFSQGQADPLAPLSIQYADYAAWQRGWLKAGLLQEQAAFWKTHLEGAPALLALPSDRPRPALQSYAGDHLQFGLSAETIAGLRALSQRHGATLFMTLLAGWSSLLARWSGQEDIVVGTPVANRGRTELEGLIGFFVNTLALRVRAEGALTVAELLAQVKASTLGAYEHQDLPFDQVVEALQPARSMGHSPLFQVMFSMNNTPGGALLDLPGMSISAIDHPSTTTQYDLVLSLTESGDAIAGSISYASDLFDQPTIARLVASLQVLLAAMANADAQPTGALPLLGAADHAVLDGFNATAAEFPHDQLIQQVFEAQAAARPNAVALSFDGVELSYCALNARANRLAHHLLALGVQADDRVALCMERSVDMIVGLLAILKAGAGYVPLDPAYPAERLALMLDDCAPVALLAQSHLAASLPPCGAPLVLVDTDAAIALQPEHNPDAAAMGLSCANLAYVIYTSGSTGRPNGVMVEHRNVLRLAVNGGFAPIGHDDCIAHCASPSFDASTWEIWGALLNGARVLLVPQPVLLDPSRFSQCLIDGGVTALWLTAGLFNEYVDALAPAFARLTYLMAGGDALDPRTVRRALERGQRPRHLINGYGPTECTTFATTFDIEAVPEHARSLPIGRPIGNTSIHILDSRGQKTPLGVPGEIHIGGMGVARGYLNRPQLTAQRFIADPFSGEADARMYKTGDLGRWLPDGTVEYLGRNDFQVKIRGFRIELGEIEAKLAACAGVREAVVLAREDQPGEKRLVAYVIAQDGVILAPAALRAELAASLAAYMIPAAFVALAAFPLTTNGKLDRRALPAPDHASSVRGEYAAPQGELESAIAAIWQDLLGLQQVGRDDDFFELGGHSLMAVQVVARIERALGLQLSLRTLFDNPTLASFCRSAAVAERSQGSAIGVADRNAALPLSYEQQRLWILDQLDDAAGAAYHIPAALRLKGTLRESALQAALDQVVARHESLRTTFATIDGQAVQVVAPADAGFALRKQDLSHLPGHEQQCAVIRIGTDEGSERFDLAAGPLVRGQLLRLSEQEHILLVTQHHIVSDGWSTGVLVREVSALYAAFSQGRGDPLTPLAIQYADYAAWQRAWLQGGALQQQAAFWKVHLEGAPALLELPLDRARPLVQSHAGSHLQFTLPAALANALRALSQRHGATLFMTLLAGWASLLARLSGQGDIVVGTPVANRGRAELEGLIGFFVNTLALRVRAEGELTVAELLAQVKSSTLGAYEHQDLPFDQVVEALQPARSLSHSPIFQVMFSMNNTPGGTVLELPGLEISAIEQPSTTTHYDLVLSLTESGDAIAGSISYASDLFDRASVERILVNLQVLLAAMAADDAQPIGRLALLDAEQRTQLVEGFNDTAAGYPAAALVHGVFEQQAAARPGAMALECDGVQVCYAELNRRANRLANHLLALGVQPDDRVAICLERGIDMVTGMLAVLKAGGCYVPLDPACPADRFAYMLGDSAPVALVTRAALAQGSVPLVLLDTDAAAIGARAEHNPAPAAGLTSASLAYVMYTSGSTGLPKGAMVEHRNILNLAINDSVVSIRAEDRCAHGANPAFDAATWEVWSCLLRGAQLFIITPGTMLDPALLSKKLLACRVNVLFLTSALLSQYATLMPELMPTLKYLLFGGEKLDLTRVIAALGKSGPEKLVNCYGPTEATVFVTTYTMPAGATGGAMPIGRPIANSQIYLLDAHLQPVPVGVTGEIFIAGDSVGRGYLNQPGLSAERFSADPFRSAAGTRMYKSGDLGRWLADGNIEYVGRNDFQVKIRGFRIELGEIEAALANCAGVREAVVLARAAANGDKQLVAYVSAHDGAGLGAQDLRAQLGATLPEYMVPGAFVMMAAFPLTLNGKLDRNALPAPDGAQAARAYQAPQGDVEQVIAAIWQELLGIERVGRDDHFFELGGHSLTVIGLIDMMRTRGYTADMRSVFSAPTVAGMAAHVAASSAPVAVAAVPANLIAAGCRAITPAMLPLVTLTQGEIDLVAARVPGGVANIADMYPLAPLQQGILFHHLMESEGDTYLLRMALSFDTQARLDLFLGALQSVIDRHDVLRTAFQWEGLAQPLQVVLRQAALPVTHLALDAGGDALAQLCQHADPRRIRLDLRQGPLVAAYVAADPVSGERHLALLAHHLVSDHVTLELIVAEVQAFMLGQGAALPPSVPYRNFISHTQGLDGAAQESYFRALLGDFDEPNAPFGMLEARSGRTDEAHCELDAALALAIRAAARAHGVTPAVLFHVAWAQVLGQCSGRDDVVFGTVLLGRMDASEGAGQSLGMFINTLPVRVALAGVTLAEALEAAHGQLTGLLAHEHAPLTLAQRCSAVATAMPLFATLLNYRHSHSKQQDAAWHGIRSHAPLERITYPVGIMVDDMGQGFSVSAMVDGACGTSAAAVGAMLVQALAELTTALVADPRASLATLNVLPEQERTRLVSGLNDTAAAYPQDLLMHQPFEAQAAATPDAVALVCDGRHIGYAELNARANRLAHHLLALGVKPDDRVAVCLERSADMIVALLAILKSGAGYVPLDPAYPAERLAFMLRDSAPVALLTQASLAAQAGALALPVVALDTDAALVAARPAHNPDPAVLGLRAAHLAYVIYTSGSTGLPKGVMIEHRNAANFLAWACDAFTPAQLAQTLFSTSINFDLHVFELFAPLSCGAALTLVRDVLGAVQGTSGLTLINTVPSTIGALLDMNAVPASVRQVNLAGEALRRVLVERLFASTGVDAVANLYGPSETTTYSTWVRMERADGFLPHIGRPIANTQVYLLNAGLALVPAGAIGEIYIGGAGVARGYLNRDDLTAERFLADPFSHEEGARMYRTGDLGRWLEDGNLEYLGRNDFQVKIRGFRIELGEVEAALAACAGVREAVVVAREDNPGDKRLVAYVVGYENAALSAASLRAAMAATLAEFMLPGAFVMLDSLPLTPNGKLDRKALPAPGAEAVTARHYEAPQGDVECALAAIWQDLLGLEQVGRSDHFFDLGGHSLLAVQLAGRIREQCHVEASLKELFDRPVLHQLAELVTALQFATFMGAEQEQMKSDLNALSESELLAMLAEESSTDE